MRFCRVEEAFDRLINEHENSKKLSREAKLALKRAAGLRILYYLFRWDLFFAKLYTGSHFKGNYMSKKKDWMVKLRKPMKRERKMKVGDLVRNKHHPDAGIGIVVEMLSGYAGAGYLDAGASASFDHGIEIIYHDEAEVISESR